jgi:hypothetical protein
MHISTVERATTSLLEELVERLARQHEHEMSTFKGEVTKRLNYVENGINGFVLVFLIGAFLFLLQLLLHIRHVFVYPQRRKMVPYDASWCMMRREEIDIEGDSKEMEKS